MRKEPKWIAALRAECERLQSQSKAGKLIGYSGGVVNAVLKGTYKGNLKKVETAVRGKLMAETVDCPVLGELRKDLCLRYQQRGFATTNHLRVQFFRTCPGCPNHQASGQANGQAAAVAEPGRPRGGLYLNGKGGGDGDAS